jgi:FdhD protein
MKQSRTRQVSRWYVDQGEVTLLDKVAEEVPTALVYNGLSYAVMMTTPTDFESFAYGFSLTEGVVESADEILGIDVEYLPDSAGVSIEIEVTQRAAHRLGETRRNLAGRTGCGLCGIESIHQAIRPIASVSQNVNVSHESIDLAVQYLQSHQALQTATGGAHAAAWCSLSGEILRVFEDVGRHNAMDKLIGYLMQTGAEVSNGFVLISSRGSYEIVQKAAALGIAQLVTLSAPTDLACRQAEAAGIRLIGFARPGRQVQYTKLSKDS